MRVGSTLLSLARDTDVAIARVFDPLAHLDPWVRVGQLVATRSIKQLQLLCPQELGCTMPRCVTPLLRPQHHRGWTSWYPPWLHIVTTTNQQHQTVRPHGAKACFLMGRSLCMASTRPFHHPCLSSLVPTRLRVRTGVMLVGTGKRISWTQTILCQILPLLPRT